MQDGSLRGFAGDEGGAISIWALFLFMAAACVSAAAVDVTHMYAVRAQMQVAADVAAHSALWRRNQGDTPDQARAEGIRAATWGMPVAEAGQAIIASRILFGTYDRANNRFVVDDNSRSAVLVTAERRRTNGNAVPTFLFRMIGRGSMDIVVSATYRAEADGCMNEGLIAEHTVDVRSNNQFRNGFCLHGNHHVEVNNNNLFEQPGVIVSMPDLADFVMPSSGFQQNTGLQAALRRGEYTLPLLDLMRGSGTTALEAALLTPGSALRPSYITSTTVNTLPVTGDVVPGSLTAGRVHRATCSGNQSLTFKPARNGPTIYSNFVLITNCAIDFSGRVDLENALIYTTNTRGRSPSSRTRAAAAPSTSGGPTPAGRAAAHASSPTAASIRQPRCP